MLAFTSHTTPHPNVLRRAAQYTTLFVADVLGVAHAPRRLARAGVVVEAVPESNALVSVDIAEVASAELVHVLFATSAVCARASGTPEALRCGRCDGAVGRPAGCGAIERRAGRRPRGRADSDANRGRRGRGR